MSRFLVTGGCGFIGSHLVQRLLTRGDRVVVLDDLSTGRRENLAGGASLVVGDVRDPDAVRRVMAGADGCFHLAAIASVERGREAWLETHTVNLEATILILDTARRAAGGRPVPVVYASSAAVYGDPGAAGPLAETAPTRPLSAYGADKLGCELHARVAWRVHGVPNVGLRFFNVYGPRQDPSSPYSGVISIFGRRIAAGEPVVIDGDGEQVRDFVHVGDVAQRLTAAMAAMRPGAAVFNVCTGRGITINALAGRIEEACGRRVGRVHGPARAGDIRVSVGDPALGDGVFGPCRTGLGEGLAETMTWLAGTSVGAEPATAGHGFSPERRRDG